MEFQSWKQIEVQKEVLDAIKKIKELQRQRQRPDRNGMISALSDAQQTAPLEILMLEKLQGDTQPIPWNCFPDADLYRKLAQYQQGLANYCIGKIGKQLFDELMKK